MEKTITELKNEISLVVYVQDWVKEKKAMGENYEIIKSGNVCTINPCPVCNHNDHLKIFVDTNSFSSFSTRPECIGERKGGSILDWFTLIEGLTEEQAKDKVRNLASVGSYKRDNVSLEGNIPPRVEKPSQSFLELVDATVRAWHTDTMNNDAMKEHLYLVCESRGIGIQTILDNHLSIIHENGGYWLVLPVKKDGKYIWYTRRALDNRKQRFNDVSGMSKEGICFNIDYLNQEHETPIFLTESMTDAMNLETMGYKAIALNSLSNFSSFMKLFQCSIAKDSLLIGAFDNDNAGQAKKEQLKEMGYPSLEIPTIKVKDTGEDVTDINDWFVRDWSASGSSNLSDKSAVDTLPIKQAIGSQIESFEGFMLSLKRKYNVKSYLENQFQKDVDKIASYKQMKTGFPNLDSHLNGLQPCLYVIGGVSSLGKTTFIHQLLDQLAEQEGQHCLYFSLEQSRLEMVSKSLARTTFKQNVMKQHEAMTSFSIRQGFSSNALKNAISSYSEYADRVSILEGNFNTNIDAIRSYVEKYIEANKVTPVVAIDYLQIMPPKENGMNEKSKTDVNVTELKRMSRDLNIPVFVISSFNRTNYLTPVGFESFKESGGIEYTADVVFGLELAVISSEEYLKLDKEAEKRLKANQAKSEENREIKLVCLKNRNGSLFDCKFLYHSKYDYFTDYEYTRHLQTSAENEVVATKTEEKPNKSKKSF